MRLEKQAIVKEIRGALEGANYALFMGFKGMKVDHINSLRNQLSGMKSKVLVVKNTFVKRAADDLGWGGDVAKYLTGPSAVITGTGDISQVCKFLKGFKKETELLTVKVGRLGDRLISASDIEAIANIPPIEVMRAKLVGTIAAPMTQVVGVMQQKVSSLLYVLKAVEEKKAKV